MVLCGERTRMNRKGRIDRKLKWEVITLPACDYITRGHHDIHPYDHIHLKRPQKKRETSETILYIPNEADNLT